MAETVKLDFNSIKDISKKTLKQFSVHRVVDTCTKSLENSAKTAPEIFKFLLIDYPVLLNKNVLDEELFQFVLPKVLSLVKKNLESNNQETLLSFVETLIKLTQFMTAEVIPVNLEILKFEHFINNSLAIIKELLLVSFDSEEESNLVVSTMSYYTAILDILKLKELIYFNDELISNCADKFSKVIVLLLDLTKIFAAEGREAIRHYVNIWQFLLKIFIINSEHITANSKTVLLITSNLNESIRNQVQDLLNSGPEALTTIITLNQKVLIRFSSAFPNESFKGHKNVLQILVFLKTSERRNQNYQNVIHQSFVAYMVILWNILKSDSMAEELFKLRFNDPEDMISLSEIHLEILKKLNTEQNEQIMQKLFPSNEHNYFSTILKHISASSCSFFQNPDLYKEFVGQLCGIMILSANNKQLFQFMEQILVTTLLDDPKVWSGMICVDVWIFVARNLHSSQTKHYFNFCRQVLKEISSPFSYSMSTIFFEYLLQFFYKLISKRSFKDDKGLDFRTKIHLGLELLASNNDLKVMKNDAKSCFLIQCEKFITTDQMCTAFDYREMLLNLKFLISSEITMEEEVVRCFDGLISNAFEATYSKLFESLLSLLIDMTLVANDTSVLNVPLLHDIFLRNQDSLSFTLKTKVIKLLKKFLGFQDDVILDLHTQIITGFLDDESPQSEILRVMIGHLFMFEEDKNHCKALLDCLNAATSKAKYLYSFLNDGIPESSDTEVYNILAEILENDKRKFDAKHECIKRMVVRQLELKEWEEKSESLSLEMAAPLKSPESSLQLKIYSSDDDDEAISYSPSAAHIRKKQILELSIDQNLTNFLNYCNCLKNNINELELTSNNLKKIQDIQEALTTINNF